MNALQPLHSSEPWTLNCEWFQPVAEGWRWSVGMWLSSGGVQWSGSQFSITCGISCIHCIHILAVPTKTPTLTLCRDLHISPDWQLQIFSQISACRLRTIIVRLIPSCCVYGQWRHHELLSLSAAWSRCLSYCGFYRHTLKICSTTKL